MFMFRRRGLLWGGALIFGVAVGLVAWQAVAAADQPVAHGGGLVFKSGQKVRYEHLGNEEGAWTYELRGKLGDQDYRVQLHELREVILADDAATVMLVNRQGKRFTLTEVEWWPRFPDGKTNGSSHHLVYRFQDPVTGKVKTSHAKLNEGTLRSITVGKDVGRLRYNPKTKEFFPPSYNFDPYTGEKLIWADRDGDEAERIAR